MPSADSLLPSAPPSTADRSSLPSDGRALIDGRRIDPDSVFVKISPVDGTRFAEIAAGTAQDVDRAVQAARRAFDSGVWSDAAPRDRGRLLRNLATLVDVNREQLATLDSWESGKPITDSRAEVDRAVVTLSYYGESADKVAGEVMPSDSGSVALVLREPVGVVGAVTPWNYPVTMPTWKFAPSLAVGNSVVLKPAEETSLCALRLAELAIEAGIPAGVLNVVPGRGEVAGAALGRHPDVDVLTFTGSTEIGKLFLRYSGESNLKRILLECGGKSPNVVFNDAPDLDAAASAIAEGIFVNAGQMCNAGSRLLVEAGIHDELVARIAEIASAWQPDDPFTDTTRMGAIINDAALNGILTGVGESIAEGAQLYVGGARARTDSGGFYMTPTVLTGCSPEMAITRQEIFGPVLTVQRVRADDAITVANDSEFGLAAAVWTRDISRAHRTARRLQAGSVYINCFDRASMSMPFGGYKQSGIGVDKSLHALDNYTQLKSVWIALDDEPDG